MKVRFTDSPVVHETHGSTSYTACGLLLGSDASADADVDCMACLTFQERRYVPGRATFTFNFNVIRKPP